MEVLRRFWPKRFPCPSCKDDERGAAIYAHKTELQYRRCNACGHEYRVRAIAMEVRDAPGLVSRIQLC